MIVRLSKTLTNENLVAVRFLIPEEAVGQCIRHFTALSLLPSNRVDDYLQAILFYFL
jgi:hypothetical protein